MGNKTELISKAKIGESTLLSVLVSPEQSDPNQLGLFDRLRVLKREDMGDWYLEVLNVARSLSQFFWFSQLRKACPMEPFDPQHDWGVVSAKLKKAGFRLTGRCRSTPTKLLPSRRGGWDMEYQRVKYD